MWWRRRARERNLERELCAHLELEAAEQRENGLVPETARDAAKRAMGNTTLVKEAVHDMYAGIALERFSQDLGYGWRSLRNAFVYARCKSFPGARHRRQRRHFHCG